MKANADQNLDDYLNTLSTDEVCEFFDAIMDNISDEYCYNKGLELRQTYIKEKSVPKFLWELNKHKVLEYMYGLSLYGRERIWGIYSTNSDFMDELISLLGSHNISATKYPFVNCECRWGLTVNV